MERREPTLEAAAPSDPAAAGLIGELDCLLDDLYHPDDNHFSLDPSEVSGNAGVFLLARLGEEAVGCGAVRMRPDGRAEVKRMFVRPVAQGTGVGRALHFRLEEEARARGATGLVLEMGDSQPAALRLYESFEFRPLPCWGEYLATPNSLCLGKDL